MKVSSMNLHVFEMGVNQQATTTKDRTGLFLDKPTFQLSVDIGNAIKNWCDQVSEKAVLEMINQCSNISSLRETFNAYPQFQILLNEKFQARKLELSLVHKDLNNLKT